MTTVRVIRLLMKELRKLTSEVPVLHGNITGTLSVGWVLGMIPPVTFRKVGMSLLRTT